MKARKNDDRPAKRARIAGVVYYVDAANLLRAFSASRFLNRDPRVRRLTLGYKYFTATRLGRPRPAPRVGLQAFLRLLRFLRLFLLSDLLIQVLKNSP